MSSRSRALCGITPMALLIVVMAAPAHAGTWVVDTKSGCQIWNPNPQLDESVSWSGSCANDRAEGRGIAQWSRNGNPSETDEGEWRNGRQVNEGTQLWSTGRYEGEISDGEPNGHGVLTLQKLRYEGEFRNGRPNGFGSLTTESETVRGIWKDGCLQGSRRASIGVPLSACR